MTDQPNPDLWLAQSDQEFMDRLGAFLQHLRDEPTGDSADIIEKLRLLGYTTCRTCDGPIEPLGGSHDPLWIHVEARDRAAPHRATPVPPGLPRPRLVSPEVDRSQNESGQQLGQPESAGASDEDRGETS